MAASLSAMAMQRYERARFSQAKGLKCLRSRDLPMSKIAKAVNATSSTETKARHPDLYPYTNPAAFEGIVRSQTLWCSHYREMTDDKEIELARSLLSAAVAPRMDAVIIEGGFNRQTRRMWKAS